MKPTLTLVLAAFLLVGCTTGENVATTTAQTKTPTLSEGTSASASATGPQASTPATTPAIPTDPVTSNVLSTEPPVTLIGNYHCDPYLFYSNLSDPLYYADACRLVDAIAAYEDYLPIENADAAVAIADNIFYNYPPAALCTFEADAGGIRIGYTFEADEHQRRIADFYARVEAILAYVVDPEWSELRKAMELYRYVSVSVNYFTVDYTDADTSAYSAITTGNAICYGFADCYNYLLRQLGIEAELLRGYRAGDYADHGWSMIKLDGEWVHCDPTWESSGTDGIGLLYFGMTDSRRFSTLARAAVCGFGPLQTDYSCDQASDDRFVKAFGNAEWWYGPWKYEAVETRLESMAS